MKRVYFGIGQGEDKDGNAISDLLAKREIAMANVAQVFGGFHAQDGYGGWINPKGELVREPSWGITVYTDAADTVIRKHARNLAALFNQESVLLAIEPVTSLEYISQ